MAYAKGTAANFADLFNKFVDFMANDPALVAAGQNAEIFFRSKPASWTGKIATSVQREHVVLKMPGLAGEDEIFTAITSYGDTALDYYNWAIKGATGFNQGGLIADYANLDTGLVSASPAVGALLWNQAIPYWFFATGRRFWVVCKISTIYTSFGAGFILPATNPKNYPYPHAIWSGYPNRSDRWSSNEDYHRGITTPSHQSMFLRQPSGRWADFYADSLSPSAGNSLVPGGQYRRVLPLGSAAVSGESLDTTRLQRDSPGGTFPLKPITLVSFHTESTAIYGEADGLYFVPVLNNGSEDEVVINGVRHVVFQSAFRTGSPYLFALRVD